MGKSAGQGSVRNPSVDRRLKVNRWRAPRSVETVHGGQGRVKRPDDRRLRIMQARQV